MLFSLHIVYGVILNSVMSDYIFFLLRTSAAHLYISLLGCLSVYPSVWCYVCVANGDALMPGRCVSQLCATIPFFLSSSRFYWFPLFFLHTLRFKTVPYNDMCGFSSNISCSSDTLSLSLLVHWANGINKSTTK